MHESKCRSPHGHNYVALVTAEAEHLDHAGRVVDFGVLKERVGGWIDENWDHGTVIQSSDVDMRMAMRYFVECSSVNAKVYYMDDAPTAENMAREILSACAPLMEETGCRLVRVELWETENCCAVAEVE